MKKSHIFAIIVIAIAVGIVVSMSGDASKYVDFKEAFEMAAENNHDKVHVVGKLKKSNSGNIIGLYYDPVRDPNYFSFIMVDNNNEEHQVVYFNPKPQDFERSEQIVVVGNVKENVFVAKEILMKCPSKYEEKEIKAGL
ncbi:MAG TPA: cytochrome c maturation protein CcmE [Cytophagaceae bacterium]